MFQVIAIAQIQDVFQINLEDVIYLLMLAGLMTMFNLIATDPNSVLFRAYRIFCILLFMSSCICLFVRSAIKYTVLLMFGVFIPFTMMGVYSNWISLDPAQSLQTYSYLGYISLVLVLVFVIVVYPLKAFIQQKIGSLYSYLYGLSVINLLGLWPLYSILEEMDSTGLITLSILYSNKSLVISFIVIIVFSFYLIVHNTFFEGDKEKLKSILKNIFTSVEINKAIEEMQNNEIKEYEWHNIQTRIMSFIVLGTTLGLEIFIFFNMSDNSSSIVKSLALMVFTLLFLILGTFYIVLPISNRFAIPIFTILSLTPAPLSFFYSPYIMYWQYVCTIFSLPYVILFWSVIRSISEYKPLMQNKILTIMYLFIHIPIMVFIMDVLDYFSSGNQVGPVGYTAIVIVGLTITLAALISVVMFCVDLFAMKTQNLKNTAELDFNHEQPLEYKPYKKLNTFTLQWLSEMNLLSIGVFLNSLLFLLSNTVAFYSINQLLNNFTSSYFFSGTIYELTYCEFPILLVFMLYCHYFMSTSNDAWDLWMLLAWLIAGVGCTVVSYIIPVVPNSFRIFGGFCLVMLLIATAFQYIKDSNKKIIPFLSPMLILSLWMTIVLPYVVVIPTASIYVDQSKFGSFIYQCILASALLLIVLVGIISMIFNILMNKFQQEKRYKYVIQDVKQFFDQQGIQSNDQILHVFHQAYESRDKKYVFYLKNGYPINLEKGQQQERHRLVTYDNYVSKKTTNLRFKDKQVSVDFCWACLTCLCGEDQDQIDQKVKGALSKNLLDQEQAQDLFPKDRFQRLNRIMETKVPQKKTARVNSGQVNSTKSLLLNSLNQRGRRLGPQYTLLKVQKSRKLGLQIWDCIFKFISNPDKGQDMVIYNDFKRFSWMCRFQMSGNDCQQLFAKYAKSSWGSTVAMAEQQFSTAMEDIAHKCYHDIIHTQNQRVMTLLVDKVYFNMAKYDEFIGFRKDYDQKRFNANSSGFNGSLQRYKLADKQRQKEAQHLVRFYKKQKGHLDQNRKQTQEVARRKKAKGLREVEQEQQEQKGKSCKRTLYDNYLGLRESCSLALPLQQNKVVKKQKIKPWSYLASESAKILHRKSALWEDQHQIKQYEFRCILNNIFMAVFKLADLYTYIEITLRDPQVKWYDTAEFSFLYLDYKYQLYLCFALAFITVPLGLKGISFISEDRLGLTQARVPASFPHPMFFYTVIYKLLVLSLFVTISTTFLVTFSCTWTQSSPYKMYEDPSIECLSTQHNIYIMLSLIFLIVYFPLSSYTFPNFQFSEKTLDLKFRPSYLVLYFQINFVLVANKVLLSQASSNSTVQISYISINIVSLLFLSLVCLKMKPCLIQWFNWVEFLTIFLGLIWNIGGLVLYLTRLWTMCVIVFGGLSIASIIIVSLIIKKVYFSNATLNAQNDQDQVKQLQLGRKYNQGKNKLMISQQGPNYIDLEKMTNPTATKNMRGERNGKKPEKDMIIVEDLIENSEPEQNTARSSGNDLNIK